MTKVTRVIGFVPGIEVCKALGISYEDVFRVVVDIPCGDVATVTVTKYLTKENGERLAETVAKVYKLEPIE